VSPGYGYTVGERGPERFMPSVPGNIVPANSNTSGGDVTVNIDMGKGSTQGAADPTQAMEFGRRVKAAVVDVISNEKRPGGTLYVRKSA
jgi:phage-related minor tail protein